MIPGRGSSLQRPVETQGFDFALLTDNDATFAGSIHGGGKLVKRGDRILTLSGNNNSTGGMSVDTGTLKLTGNLNIEQGTLRLGHANVVGDDQVVTISSGARLDYTYNKTDERIGGLAGDGGVVNLRRSGVLTVGNNQQPTTRWII